jgi:hypothetical protein
MLLSYRYRNGDPHVTCCYPIRTVMGTSCYMLLFYWYRNGDPHVTCCYPIRTVKETLTLHAAILSVP